MSQKQTIRPGDRLSESAVSAARQILKEILVHRDHVKAAFKQDFRGTYHGSFLGVFWNFTLPLVPISIYAMLASFRVFPTFPGVSPGTYVALGGTIWFLLVGCINQPLQTVQARNAEVMKTAMPLSAMVVSGFSQTLFEFAVRIVLVGLLIAATGTKLHWTAALVPLVLLPAGLLFLGIGLIASVANVIYTDVGRLTGIALQYGLFLSGVIFPVSALPMSTILVWNPAYVLIENVRILAFLGLPDGAWLLGAYSLVGVLVFLLGCRVFYAMEYRVRGIG